MPLLPMLLPPPLLQEWGDSNPAGETKFQLAACLGFNGSETTRGLFIGWLAGTAVIDRALTPKQLPLVMRGLEQPGSRYSLASAAVSAGLDVNATLVPTHPVYPSSVHQFVDATVCATPSPNDLVFHHVPKSASITVMAWVQLRDTPRQKEACIVSHGSWETGWKLSM